LARKPTLYRARTRDGYRIALWHYKGNGTRRTPALLVHGLGSNRYDLDFPDPRYSLAWAVNDAGFDTWVVELRGAGASNARLRKALQGYTIDDYVMHDIPAALRCIQDESGHESVHWIGHSLGGMLAYPAIATSEPRIKSAVTIGAPAMQRPGHAQFEFALPVADAFLRLSPYYWGYKRMLQVGSFGIRLTARAASRFFFTFENCDLADLARVSRAAIDDVPSGVQRQMIEWYRAKRMTTHYGTVDPIEALTRSKTPLLVVAGARDRLTPLADVRIAYDKSGSPHKELLILGREHGCQHDYGHVDMIFGRHAREEVFGHVVEFVKKHDAVVAQPALVGSA
jgi:pimeloyl-ACP methyl ester carboxylesterase